MQGPRALEAKLCLAVATHHLVTFNLGFFYLGNRAQSGAWVAEGWV